MTTEPEFELSDENFSRTLKECTDPVIRNISETVRNASLRILPKIDPSGRMDYLASIYYPGLDDIYLTDKHQEIFGLNETIYTITSTLALEEIQDGKILVPPSEHFGADRNIQTHRGIGLYILTRLLQAYDFDLGAKDNFVWLGSKVDGEQFVIEDNIAQNGTEIDEKLALMFFNEKDIKNSENPVEFHPQFKKLVDTIQEDQSIYGQDETFTNYVDSLLTVLHQYTGIRDGWFNSVEGIFKGQIKPVQRNNISLEAIQDWAHIFAQPVPKSSRAAILEIDSSKLLNRFPVYAFPIGRRPPEAIIPAPYLPVDVVKAIYVESDTGGLEQFGDTVKTLDQFTLDNYLQDKDGNVITPAKAREQGVDPRNPICMLRYKRNPISTWAENIGNGNIIPATGILNLDLIRQKTYTDQSLRSLVLTRAEESGMLSQLQSTMQDKVKAQEKILIYASHNLNIPPPQIPIYS